RLGSLVIRAEPQSFDLIIVLTARGEDDDRKVGLLPNLFENRETVAARKREIEDDEVGSVGIDDRERLIPVGGLERPQVEIRESERAADKCPHIGLVVDDQDLHGVASGSEVTKAAPPPGFSS